MNDAVEVTRERIRDAMKRAIAQYERDVPEALSVEDYVEDAILTLFEGGLTPLEAWQGEDAGASVVPEAGAVDAIRCDRCGRAAVDPTAFFDCESADFACPLNPPNEWSDA